jgi:nucleoside 2-deoxyribosyltransferase
MSKSVYKVYAAGSITGMTYDQATEWRNELTERLKPFKIEVISPMRAKAFLKGERSIEFSYENDPIANSRAIITRDRLDVTRADAVVFNLHKDYVAPTVSVGTMIEIGWADMLRKPIIVWSEKGSIYRNHAMVREAATHFAENMNDVALICSQLFCQ